MSAMANTTPIVTTVMKPATNPGREKMPRDADATPGLTSRISIKNTTRTSCQSLWTRFVVTSKKKSMLEAALTGMTLLMEIVLRVEDFSHGVGESYDNSHSYYETGINYGYRYHDKDRSRHVKRRRDIESLLSRDPEDHINFFQAAAQVERWAMPTWCHMFNSTLIGATRVWFDELPPESIDSYKDLKAAFLAYFMQQKKYVKDPIEIHNIKQKDEETIDMNGYCKNHEKRAKNQAITDTRMESCMRTRNFYFPNNSSEIIPRSQNKRRTSNVVEPELHTIVEVADNRTMEELLQAPMEGYEEAIVIPEINADHFEIKTNLLQLVQANPYYGFERENLHTHINNLKRITSTLKFKDVPNDEDLVNKFVNQFFPPSKTTHLKNKISSFTQRFEETFGEAWERFKEILRACPHHGFTELAQIDTFYNGLNDNDQDSLNAAADGNLLSKTTREALQIIENKSKVRYSRNKPNVSRMNTTSRDNASKSDDRIDKLADQISTLVDIFAKKIVTPAPVKAVEESCVTCGGNHAYYNCPNTNLNQPSVCVAMGTYNKVAPQNRASNYIALPSFAPMQNGQNRDFQTHLFKFLIIRFNKNQSSTSGTLPSNTIPTSKGKMKAITTRSGVAYEGPLISTPKKVVEQETKETTDKEQSNFQGSNAHIQPPAIPIPEPDILKTLPKPNLPYPLRLNDQKLVKRLQIKWRSSSKSFKIFTLTLVLRMHYS
uniref:Reverse transcriptase domain-containing protein n=1 Tax=Tanacetum cinerariifolium TaxID=118510 RepID=A0A6L2JDG9_TANCI|nr:reverse transcriptase domain-containing protein [Tanacetum cinerariifolium]